MKKLSLADFRGNVSRYNFYLDAHNILNEIENQRMVSKSYHGVWAEYSELRDITATMDDILKRAEATREILRQQNNENYTQSKNE